MLPAELLGRDSRGERMVAETPNKQPVRQSRSTTPAMAWPKPMHMQATP
jgi:hypothetical protein